MVRHLRFLLSLASRPLSQIDYLRARRVYCASVSLGVPVTLALRVLSIHSVSFSCLGFFGRVYAPPSLGALGHVFLACPWPSLECFLSAFWAMTWWPLSSSLTPNLLALSAPGAAFFRLFLGYDSLFISVLARLLGPSLAFPVLRFWFFAGASLACLLYFWSSNRMRRSVVLSNSHLLLFDGHLSLVLSLLSVGGGEEIKI